MSSDRTFKPARPWQSHPRETVALALLGCAAALALVGASRATPTLVDKARATTASEALPTSPSATDLRDVAPEQAMALNAQIPLAGGPVAAAAPFSLRGANKSARAQALECLTSAIYYEAGQESDAGQRAVAQVILNRVRHPAYPATVCGVVYEGSTRPTGCQFTFTCDGSLMRPPMISAWNRASKIARAALEGAVYEPVGLATHYHANYVLPYWAASLVKTRVEGAHLFYRWSGNWGRPAAFTQRYAGREPDARALRLAALSVPHVVSPAMATAAAAEAIKLDNIEGIEVRRDGGGRIIAKFEPQARAAVEAIKLVPYVERVAASDNLRRALDGNPAEGTAARPFGPPVEAMDKSPAPAS